ncbi:MAG: secretion protein HlyD [Phenylobacterium zucineum]|nr:MAG: secretion protein HlyD [Phenylobacterium zucineum]
MVIGTVLVGVFVVGLLVWAAFAPLTGAVMAPGVVRVESNRKEIRHLSGGIVRQILVKEGQRVAAGQTLLILDAVQPKASVDINQSQADAYTAQLARYQAEATGKRTVTFPPELLARANDPVIAGLMRDQQFLFATRLQFFESQNDILGQRVQQIDANIAGIRAQLDATDDSIKLTQQELAGYQTLYEKGFAPKTLILRYQRSLSDLAGRRGQLMAEITQAQEQKGETRMQIATQRDQRISQAADGLRQMQMSLTDVLPRVTAARQMMADTVVKSPVDGYVLQLTQFTQGGVIVPGEPLMSIVPADSPLIVTVKIKPDQVDDVHVGMKAKVRLTAFNSRKSKPVEAVVTSVSADQITEEKTGAGYFRVDLRIEPGELAKNLPKGSKISPGMPAQAQITTGTNTVLHYIISPLTDTIGNALHEG